MDVRRYLVQELNDAVTSIAASLIDSNDQLIDTIICVGVMDWVSQDFWLVGGVTQNNTRPSPKAAFKSQQPSCCSVANEATFSLNLFRLPKVASHKSSDCSWFYWSILRMTWTQTLFLSSCFHRAMCAATSSSGNWTHLSLLWFCSE